jgi:hypothetical protein
VVVEGVKRGGVVQIQDRIWRLLHGTIAFARGCDVWVLWGGFVGAVSDVSRVGKAYAGGWMV